MKEKKEVPFHEEEMRCSSCNRLFILCIRTNVQCVLCPQFQLFHHKLACYYVDYKVLLVHRCTCARWLRFIWFCCCRLFCSCWALAIGSPFFAPDSKFCAPSPMCVKIETKQMFDLTFFFLFIHIGNIFESLKIELVSGTMVMCSTKN